MEVVYVRWVDSATHRVSTREWIDPEDLEDGEVICETVGWLVKENTHSLYVAGSIAPDEVCCVMQIPKSAVRSRPVIDIG